MSYEFYKMKRQQLLDRISKAESKIQSRKEHIAQMIDANNREQVKLEKLLLSLEKLESEQSLNHSKVRPRSPKQSKTSFLSFENCDIPNIGLFNKTVLFPVAKCNLHQCYLSYPDVRKRKCVMRMCKHMEWVQDNFAE